KDKAHLAKHAFSLPLLFDTNTHPYATPPAATLPECCNPRRYAMVPRDGEPYIFGFGSEVAAHKLNSPWIAERAYPAHTTMFGALPRDFGGPERFIRDLEMVMEIHGLKRGDPIGIDVLDAQLAIALQEAGFRFGDGQDVMQRARMIKTERKSTRLNSSHVAIS